MCSRSYIHELLISFTISVLLGKCSLSFVQRQLFLFPVSVLYHTEVREETDTEDKKVQDTEDAGV